MHLPSLLSTQHLICLPQLNTITLATNTLAMLLSKCSSVHHSGYYLLHVQVTKKENNFSLDLLWFYSDFTNLLCCKSCFFTYTKAQVRLQAQLLNHADVTDLEGCVSLIIRQKTVRRLWHLCRGLTDHQKQWEKICLWKKHIRSALWQKQHYQQEERRNDSHIQSGGHFVRNCQSNLTTESRCKETGRNVEDYK